MKLWKDIFNYSFHYFFQLLLGLETSMKVSDFMFDYVHLLHFKSHKINFNCGDHIKILLIGYKKQTDNTKFYQ